jgi:hypothetical protein
MEVPIPNSASESMERMFVKTPLNPRYSDVRITTNIFLKIRFATKDIT